MKATEEQLFTAPLDYCEENSDRTIPYPEACLWLEQVINEHNGEPYNIPIEDYDTFKHAAEAYLRQKKEVTKDDNETRENFLEIAEAIIAKAPQNEISRNA